ncbi:MAG: Hsp20/alpha crystallin family protein [Zetaproteobacteria bacterium]|nr:MAG: Hsp20/alpha crystallin family protein [Zetaproteobacteria bacterium]
MGVQPWPGPGWDPFGDLALIKQEMTRLLEQVLSQGSGRGQPAESAWAPPLDVCETPAEFRVQVEVPGVAGRQIRLEFSEGTLTIRAERPIDPALRADQIQQMECRYGSFFRRLALPSPIDHGRIRATCRDGVLDIRLPKRTMSQTRHVAIEPA